MSQERFASWQVFDEQGRRKYLTASERTRFLAAADRLPPAARAFCHVLVFTGCRVSEALDLRNHQLDVERMALVLRTLKRRQLRFRSVPIPEPLFAMLVALKASEDGKLWNMHRATAWRLIKRVMTEVDVSGPMACCRGLRHGFGIRAASVNIPPNTIQRWLGHSSLTTTSIYIDAVGLEERNLAERLWS